MNPFALTSCLLALLLASASSAQLLPSNTATGLSSTPPAQPTAPTTSQDTKTATTAQPTDTTTQSSSSTTPSTTSQTSSTTSSSQTTSTVPPLTSAHSIFTSTDSSGAPTTVTVTTSSNTTGPSQSTSPSPAPNGENSGGGLGVGSIIGISVAGGIAVIGIVAFVIWKLTRKRFSDFDDNEAIKWPELNSHGNIDSHPLPVHTTGRAGFETGSEASLSRVNSSNFSTPDFAGGVGPDPYAVPPLPHLNPNQPYRDDPSGPAGYYDPYRGPVPGTLENDGGDWPGEAIPMTQMNAGARMLSPTPSANAVYDGGRQSPAPPLMTYQGRASPGPQIAYAGRLSPSPHAAYGGANYDGYSGR